jgi:4-aminobutyrate aminotransferase-like enzyme
MLIVELLRGDGGYVVPPKEWLPMIKTTCEKHGALLVTGEI